MAGVVLLKASLIYPSIRMEGLNARTPRGVKPSRQGLWSVEAAEVERRVAGVLAVEGHGDGSSSLPDLARLDRRFEVRADERADGLPILDRKSVV